MESKSYLLNFISRFYKPTFRTSEGVIAKVNSSARNLFGNIPVGLALSELIPQGVSVHETALSSQRTSHEDFVIDTALRPKAPISYIVVPISRTDAVHIVVDIMDIQETLLMHLQTLQRTPADSLWMLSTNMQILWCKKDNFSRGDVGLYAPDLVREKEKLFAAAEKAQRKRGRTVSLECTMTTPVDGMTAVYVDIVYMPPLYAGGYYLATTRRQPTGTAVLSRMREAVLARTDSDLAKILHISQSTVSKIKSNPEPPLDLLYAISTQHKVSFDWLLYGHGEKKRIG